MKTGLHPKYYKATAVCTCGNTFTIGSTKQELRLDVCAKCHPFYTKEQRRVSNKGRIARFRSRYGLSGNAKG